MHRSVEKLSPLCIGATASVTAQTGAKAVSESRSAGRRRCCSCAAGVSTGRAGNRNCLFKSPPIPQRTRQKLAANETPARVTSFRIERRPPHSPMASLRHDPYALLPPPPPDWRAPPAASRRRLPDEPLAAGPVLPRIASLLRPPPAADADSRKRKLPGAAAERPPDLLLQPPTRAAVPRMEGAARLAVFNQQLRRRPDCEPAPPSPPDRFADAACRIPAVSSAMRRAVYREFGPGAVPRADAASPPPVARSRVRPTPADMSTRYVARGPSPPPRDPPRMRPDSHLVERRRLYYHHSIDPHKIHEIHIPAEIPVVPHYHDGLPRKHRRTSRYHHQVSPSHALPAYYDQAEEEELEIIAQKRRRVASPSPRPHLRQPLYEPEYGLAVLETSKPLMRSRFAPDLEPADDAAVLTARRRYVRGDSFETKSARTPVSAEPRISYNGSEGIVRTSACGVSTPPAPRSLVNVEKPEPTPLTTLVLKSKEFLKSKSLVRNRHDEIDWVATFLKVGFDSSSIYALMCPLRKGRWKSEEENYTMGLLRLIENGTILLRHGQSIRGYIGEQLHSDDMRVLKKLSNCKMFHFAKLINPRLAEEEKLDMSVGGAREGLERLNQLKGEFLRSVQLEALVAVRKYLSDSSLRDLLNVRA